ncbi:hypothetical protein Lalb_Chr11g0071351 [Lupinus albus]|uniref:Uncharacterized protein n=1 Tax=Lupinus albus TaxID=3870 RepID=A0A6A4PRV8_LUPAL|nr:hypothetical protein Lalb_Chr11g0071351 [Lupinus albus]
MFLTFYKGRKINIWPFYINLLHLNGHVIPLHADSNNKLVGILCAISSCFCVIFILSYICVKLSLILVINNLK